MAVGSLVLTGRIQGDPPSLCLLAELWFRACPCAHRPLGLPLSSEWGTFLWSLCLPQGWCQVGNWSCTKTPDRAGAPLPLGDAEEQSRHVGGAQGVCGVEIRLLLHPVCQSQNL